MILEKPSPIDNNSFIQEESNVNENIVVESASRINTDINANGILLLTRGFNHFLLFGMSPHELQMLRLLFHSSIYQQNLQRGISIDWSYEAMLSREEEWLRTQSMNHNNGNSNRSVSFGQRRRVESTSASCLIVVGFLSGMILSLFGIILLCLCNFSPEFKFAFKIGMIVGTFFYLPPALTKLVPLFI